MPYQSFTPATTSSTTSYTKTPTDLPTPSPLIADHHISIIVGVVIGVVFIVVLSASQFSYAKNVLDVLGKLVVLTMHLLVKTIRVQMRIMRRRCNREWTNGLRLEDDDRQSLLTNLGIIRKQPLYPHQVTYFDNTIPMMRYSNGQFLEKIWSGFQILFEYRSGFE